MEECHFKVDMIIGGECVLGINKEKYRHGALPLIGEWGF